MTECVSTNLVDTCFAKHDFFFYMAAKRRPCKNRGKENRRLSWYISMRDSERVSISRFPGGRSTISSALYVNAAGKSGDSPR